MAYINETDLEKAIGKKKLGGLTQDSGDTNIPDHSVVLEICEGASAIVDSYISAKKKLPVGTVPPVIKQITLSIAIYLLYSRRHEAVKEEIETRYTNAIAWLKDVGKGIADIPELEDKVPAAATTDISVVRSTTEGKTPVFTDENLAGF